MINCQLFIIFFCFYSLKWLLGNFSDLCMLSSQFYPRCSGCRLPALTPNQGNNVYVYIYINTWFRQYILKYFLSNVLWDKINISETLKRVRFMIRWIGVPVICKAYVIVCNILPGKVSWHHPTQSETMSALLCVCLFGHFVCNLEYSNSNLAILINEVRMIWLSMHKFIYRWIWTVAAW